jgi:undecaprenyl-diphosphatase
MSLWEALLLGVVQGATEFLPVSSSGHLVITQALLGIRLPGVVFEVVVHLATLVSILLVYRTRVATVARGFVTGEHGARSYVALLVLATLPAAVVGLLFEDRVEALFDSPAVPGVALLVTGAVLWTARWALERTERPLPSGPGAFLIGVAQACALVPGISRSGSTVVAALWLRVDAEEAAAFSFLMAVPAIAGAAVLQIPEIGSGAGPGVAPLLAGGVAAAVTGVVAIRTFVAMLARRSFHLFAPYCWAVGGLYLLWLGLPP